MTDTTIKTLAPTSSFGLSDLTIARIGSDVADKKMTGAVLLQFVTDNVNYISNIEGDAAPKLGGDLDLNGFTIEGLEDILPPTVKSVGFHAVGDITTGKVRGYATVGYEGTIKAWNFAVDAGTATVKVWKVAAGSSNPVSGDSISAAGVSIATGQRVRSTDVSDFTTTAVAIGDTFAFEVTAVSGVGDMTFTLDIEAA